MRDGGEDRIVYDAGPQSGGREPAPGRLGLVQAFVNSWYDLEHEHEHEHGAELLVDPPALAAWLSARGLLPEGSAVSRKEFKRALAIRDGLRALLIANNGGVADEGAVRALGEATGRASFGLRFAGAGAEFVAQGSGFDRAMSAILAVVAEAMLDGSWSRFKACREHDCHWAFYDRSRNAAGGWCSMSVCGSRAKQRAYYRRGVCGSGRRP
jgi:predicted RNA-binding Zn ribbon-like protein